MIQLRETLELLARFNVDFVIAGGVAANLHGSGHATFDLDICYSRRRENLERLAAALTSIHATLRNAPKNLPFHPDAETLIRGLNFTFDTDLGELDLLGEVSGVGRFEDASADANQITLFGALYRVLKLEKLIAAKRVAGRTKDLLVLPELEAILEFKKQGQ